MKQLWLAIILILLATPVFAGNVVTTGMFGTVSAPSYLLDETFGAVGLPASWTAIEGTVGTHIILAGDGQMVLTTSGGTNAIVSTASVVSGATTYACIHWRYSASVADASNMFFELYDSGNNMVARASIFGNDIAVRAGGGTNSDPYTLTAATDYFIKIVYVAGSGADATATLYTSTDGTTWTQRCVSNDGTVTTNAAYAEFTHYNTAASDFTYYQVRIDDADFDM